MRACVLVNVCASIVLHVSVCLYMYIHDSLCVNITTTKQFESPHVAFIVVGFSHRLAVCHHHSHNFTSFRLCLLLLFQENRSR